MSNPSSDSAYFYDYIIAGAGCAGLSLAYRLQQSQLRDKRILLVDPSPKNQNDRTWSFWTDQNTMFEPIVKQQWDHLWFKSPHFSALLDIRPYAYKTIQGLDFYHYTQAALRQNPQITCLQAKAEHIQNHPHGASLKINGDTYQAKYIFNSIPPRFEQIPAGYHALKQHFLGWVIRTEKPTFNPKEATFMDFSVPQPANEARFFYLLPTSEYQSLVEYTLFSETLLPKDVYKQELRKYIQDTLGIKHYEILEEEFGIIPMADLPLNPHPEEHIIHLGTAGGRTKASSGYSFLNIQEQSDLIFKALLEDKNPGYYFSDRPRFRLYDSMLLNVMSKGRYPAHEIFANLFKKHSPQRVLRFLGEGTHFGEELQIMASMPPLPFVKAFFDIVGKRKNYFRLPKNTLI